MMERSVREYDTLQHAAKLPKRWETDKVKMFEVCNTELLHFAHSRP